MKVLVLGGAGHVGRPAAQILVSSLLKELTESAGEFAFGGGRAVSLKGISGKHRLFQVQWQ